MIKILTAMNKRHEVSRIFAKSIRRFMDSSPYPITCTAVISEEESKPICEEFGIEWVVAPNDYLGRKWNAGLSEAMKSEWQYLLIMGDDDLLHKEVWGYYTPLIDRGEKYFGFNQYYIHEIATGSTQLVKLTKWNKLVGCGRMIARECLRFPLWQDKQQSGLDYESERHLPDPFVIDAAMIVDLKSEQNIWKFRQFRLVGVPCEIDLNLFL